MIIYPSIRTLMYALCSFGFLFLFLNLHQTPLNEKSSVEVLGGDGTRPTGGRKLLDMRSHHSRQHAADIRGPHDTHFGRHDHTDLHTVRAARDRDWDHVSQDHSRQHVKNDPETLMKYIPTHKHAYPQVKYSAKIEYCCTHTEYSLYCATGPIVECPKQFRHAKQHTGDDELTLI
eukprot:CAMPEP_0118922722 /NCGR_PEP_ID=MMETSP1169-20130426/1557_1 /TAXON_ID=36882 /ORGANISM="Pyramimonas obovata, Strain CCMP722" /LENGTH=174 /DNA_ID=CAMNT_0006863641 /DNA_START=148 /DNA_END=672 /DNA_ORIENTATION=-